MFENKNITILIAGGIAAYKVPFLVRLFQKDGANVRVVLTKHGAEFVTPLVFESLLHVHTYTDLFADPNNPAGVHGQLANWTDLAVIVPATANVVGKMAKGIADDLVSTTLIAMTKPKYLVPAMNTRMLHSAPVQRNLQQLKTDGIAIIEPKEGLLAEGYSGDGRMPEPQEIFDSIVLKECQRLSQSPLKQKHVVITAGGTKERIDPVRYISNDSSGKMGFALADQAAKLGASVTLISANTHLPVPLGVTQVAVTSALEMKASLDQYFEACDVVIMAAAVADYRPKHVLDHKIKKGSTDDLTKLELTKNPDIVAGLGARKTHQFVVGFAAETSGLAEFGRQKLLQKNADMIVANDVSQDNIGFNSDENAALILTPADPVVQLPAQPKSVIAAQILAQIAQRL